MTQRIELNIAEKVPPLKEKAILWKKYSWRINYNLLPLILFLPPLKSYQTPFLVISD